MATLRQQDAAAWDIALGVTDAGGTKITPPLPRQIAYVGPLQNAPGLGQ